MTLRRWAAGIAAFVLSVVIAPSAIATTYYLNGDTGNNANAGTSSALAWKTLAYANSYVSSGDVIRMERYRGGNYQGAFAPACQSSPTDWVTYVGDIDHPEWVTVTDGTIGKRYVSIKGVQFIGDVSMEAAWDSLQYCKFTGGCFLLANSSSHKASRYSYVGNSTCSAYQLAADGDAPAPTSPGFQVRGAVGNSFNNVKFTNLYGDSRAASDNKFQFTYSDSCSFTYCTFNVNPWSGCAPSCYFSLKLSKDASFRACRFNFNETNSSLMFMLRDSVLRATFDCDTFLQVNSYDTDLSLSRDGSCPWGSVRGTVMDSCYIRMKNSSHGAWFQNWMSNVTFTRNVVINESGPAMTLGKRVIGRNFIDHNTFVGNVENGGMPVAMAEVAADNCGGYPCGWQDWTVVTNNIFYSFPPYSHGALNTFTSAVGYDAATFDSSYYNGGAHSNHLRSDHNLYSYYGLDVSGQPDTVGKKSIGYHVKDLAGTNYFFSWPGKHTVFRYPSTFPDSVTLTPGVFADTVTVHLVTLTTGIDSTYKVAVQRTVVTPPQSGKIAIASAEALGDFIVNVPWTVKWCPGCDDSSTYGSPVFVDSTAAGLDPRLFVGSLARGLASGGGDVGAIASVAMFSFVTLPTVVSIQAAEEVGTQSGVIVVGATGSDTTALCSVDSIGSMVGNGLVPGLTVTSTTTGPGTSFHVPSQQHFVYTYVPDGYTGDRSYYLKIYFGDVLKTTSVVRFDIAGDKSGAITPGPGFKQPFPHDPPHPPGDG
jgi:hypothetical protein